MYNFFSPRIVLFTYCFLCCIWNLPTYPTIAPFDLSGASKIRLARKNRSEKNYGAKSVAPIILRSPQRASHTDLRREAKLTSIESVMATHLLWYANNALTLVAPTIRIKRWWIHTILLHNSNLYIPCCCEP